MENLFSAKNTEMDKGKLIMSDYPQVSLLTASEELNRLHENIVSNTKESRILKRKYNAMVTKEYKIKDKEQLIEYLYCNSLKEKGVCFQNQVIVENGRIDVLTDDFIIEIKYGGNRSKVFEAIGQLYYYNIFYPGRDLKIVLSEKPCVQTARVLKKLNIQLEVYNV